ncbi:MAG: divalent-cation tolerance protein CutA [Candidatus Caenarcaniphilales bacterium]|nr:divalent-cation tolerance protein CutA [Candidatus Caenarcaniphilales bacterium]
MSSKQKIAFKLIYIPCPTLEEAKGHAQSLLQKKLVACANIIPNISSLYWWGDQIQENQEVLLILKTSGPKVVEVIASIELSHSYSSPAILVIPITNLNANYADWLNDQLA